MARHYMDRLQIYQDSKQVYSDCLIYFQKIEIFDYDQVCLNDSGTRLYNPSHSNFEHSDYPPTVPLTSVPEYIINGREDTNLSASIKVIPPNLYLIKIKLLQYKICSFIKSVRG